MIKVFRKFRVQLTREGKLKRYLLYGLGEIVLVVIGILIALGIDNWNDDRMKAHREQIYLTGLQKEFLINKAKLEELIRVNRSNFDAARKITALISNPDPMVTEEQFSTLLFQAFANDLAYSPNNSLLNELISSGNLNDLSSTALRVHLATWIATLEDVAKQESDLGIQRNSVVSLLAEEKFSLRKVLDDTGISKELLSLNPVETGASNFGILKSTAFENRMLLFMLSCQATEQEHYQPLLEVIDTILDMLETQIQ
ncbi:MAG: hypothetical protein D6816_06495 [Bacteroidetes bacterium]|nr:MAG: hypothetical protein D6816_06495 [Bacteroidota bacterium]